MEVKLGIDDVYVKEVSWDLKSGVSASISGGTHREKRSRRATKDHSLRLPIEPLLQWVLRWIHCYDERLRMWSGMNRLLYIVVGPNSNEGEILPIPNAGRIGRQ